MFLIADTYKRLYRIAQINEYLKQAVYTTVCLEEEEGRRR